MTKNKLIYSLILTTFASSIALSQTNTFYCSSMPDQKIEMEVVVQNNRIQKVTTEFGTTHLPDPSLINSDQSAQYQIVISDYNDTVTDFEFDIKNNKIVNKKRYTSGHDSDNVYGSLDAEGESAFTCVYKSK